MTQKDAQESGMAAQRPDDAKQHYSFEKSAESEGRCTLGMQSGSTDNQMVCIKHAMAVREHTASWLGIAVVGVSPSTDLSASRLYSWHLLRLT